MNCNTAKLIDLVYYLKKQGFKTGKTTVKDTWFYSPFRVNEKTPSFKVDDSKNLWYDFGEGIGGTIIDFIMKYDNCSIKEALSILSEDSFPIHQQKKVNSLNQFKPNYIKKLTILTNQKLLDYLTNRGINLKFAKRFCCQVYYSFSNGKELYGIGFMNDSGGFEIVNTFSESLRKICLGKKDITAIDNKSDVVSVFESWSDYLSYLTLKDEMYFEDFVILNSTSLIKKTIGLLDSYSEIKLFFDNDIAGDKATDILIKHYGDKVFDSRVYYKKHNDLNDYLVYKKSKE